MHAEYFLVYERSNGKAIEDIAKDAPESNRVSAFALVVEAVDSVDLGAFVISAQHKEVLGVLDFITEEQANSLN